MDDYVFVSIQKCSPFHVKSNCYLSDLFDVQGFAFEIRNVDDFEKITG